MKRTVVIMAGGAGERFWPLSRLNHPKQLLKLASDKTLLEEAIDRISSLISYEDIFIITGIHLLEPIRKAVSNIPPENIVAEPMKRNTAPCLALAAAFIYEKYKLDYSSSEISIGVLTADQDIRPTEIFQKNISQSFDYIEKNPVLSTIGIKPTRPETGYGYIEIENSDSNFNSDSKIQKVISFREKPDLIKALEYIESNLFYWNSGMFFYRLDTFISELNQHCPEIGSGIDLMRNIIENKTNIIHNSSIEGLDEIFQNFPNISIDYALMEKSNNIVVVPSEFQWDDIGSWDSLDRIRNLDENNNIIDSDTTLIDSKNSIIINELDSKIKIVGLGLEELVVVLVDDVLMICPKSRVQEIKKCVEQIRLENRTDLL